jgi:uncharacterized protein (TIGR02996 family)
VNARDLLAQIVAEPDDLSVRRVYADHLLAKGDPRGTFIHAQCELEIATGERRTALQRLCDELLAAHAEEWTKPLNVKPGAAVFLRGFVEHWTCSPRLFHAHAAKVLRSTPLRRLVVGPLGRRDLETLIDRSQFRRMSELELFALDTWPFRLLAAAELPRLRRFMITGIPRGRSDALEGMLRQRWAQGLVELGLDCPVEHDEIFALESSGAMERLKTLRIRNRVPLVAAPKLQRLEAVAFQHDGSLVSLIEQRAPALRELALIRCTVSPRLVTSIVATPALRVELEGCAVSPSDVERLAARP